MNYQQITDLALSYSDRSSDQELIANCRSQGMRSGWNPDYDVENINPYFVAGVQDV